MTVEGDPRWTAIVDKQFEMLGIKLQTADIPEHGVITVGKKKDYWYNVYKLTEPQEAEWLKWAREQLVEQKTEDPDEILRYLDLRYGLPRSYTKTGQLF